MEIKHFIILIISIFYLLSFSTSIRPPPSTLNVNLKIKKSPEAPDSEVTPEAPDDTPEAPDDTPEAPDDTPDSTPGSPDGHEEESGEAENPSASASASFKIMPGGSFPELEKLCGATDFPTECVLCISPFLNDSVNIDPIVVLKAGLNAAANLSKQAIEKANELQKDPKTTPDTDSSLNVCIENYGSMPDNTASGLEAIDKRDMETLKTSLSADVTCVNTCIDDYGKKKSPMKKMDSTLLNLVSANLQIATDKVRF